MGTHLIQVRSLLFGGALLLMNFLQFFDNACLAQNLIIRGSVLCKPKGREGFERAVSNECVVVIPKGFPEKATTTSSDGAFSIVFPFKNDFLNKIFFIDFKSQHKLVGTLRIFLGSEKLSKLGEDKILEIAEPIILREKCDFLSFNSDSCWFELKKYTTIVNDTAREKPSYSKKKLTWLGSGVGVAGGVLAALLTQDGGSSPPPPPIKPDSIKIERLAIKSLVFPKINLPALLSSQLLLNHPNNNNNFAPIYNLDKAIFTNSSTVALLDFSILNVNTEITEFIELYQVGGATKITDRFGLGFGCIILKQREQTIVRLLPGGNYQDLIPSKSMLFLVPFGIRVHSALSLGFSYKILNQKIEFPTKVIKTTSFFKRSQSVDYQLVTSSVDSAYSDFDLSMTIVPSKVLRFGITLNNVRGTGPLSQNKAKVKTRSVGMGFGYKNNRFVIGADGLFIEKDKAIIGTGMQYILTNWLDINWSAWSRYKTAQFGCAVKYKGFRINYNFSRNNLYDQSHLIGMNFSF